ncbi:proteinase-activated receptor 3-like isoform X1 [Mobula hypostoma]|uniref:proteinase-activated receptor 3-like isoform X1 n=1 Tax=Mobula hypostoma TaxID=723540 RepID=UPI002FC37E00
MHEGLSEGNVHKEIRCSCGRTRQEGSVSLQSEKEYWFHSLRGSSLKPFCLGLPHKLNSETVWSCYKMNCSILLRAILLCVFWSRQEANRSLDYDDYNDTESIVSEVKAETHSVPSVSDIMRGYRPNVHRANGSNETIYTVTGTVRNQLTGLTTTVTIPGLYVLVFTIGLPANGLGLWVLATKIRKLPSTIFLISLATADLLLILMLPFKISYHFLGNNWLFGEALCRTTTAFFYGNMYCSILLLTVISVDRYFALVYPFTSRQFRDNAFAISVCSSIWVIAALLVLPFLFKEQLLSIDNLNITTCHDVLPVDSQAGYFFYYFVCLVIMGFLIPCCITVFCYGSVIKTLIVNEKSYMHAAIVTFLILLVYVGCFAPSNIILLIHHSEYHHTNESELYIYYMVCMVVSSSSSCIDPFIYYYISDEFRVKVVHVICCRKEQRGLLSGRTTQELLNTHTYTSHSRAGMSVKDA